MQPQMLSVGPRAIARTLVIITFVVGAVRPLDGLDWIPQTPDQSVANLPRFEAASIRPSTSATDGGSLGTFPNRVAGTNITTRALLVYAYSILGHQLVGGPEWIRTDRYTIAATASDVVSRGEMQLMMRALLADRFQMVLHSELRSIQGYALVVARPDKLGPNMRPTTRDCRMPPSERLPSPPGVPNTPPLVPCGLSDGPGFVRGGSIGLATLTETLVHGVGGPVEDRTGLSGLFDILLRWTEVATAPTDPASDAPSIFAAVEEQLGLKLQPQRIQSPVMVIDSASRPKEN